MMNPMQGTWKFRDLPKKTSRRQDQIKKERGENRKLKYRTEDYLLAGSWGNGPRNAYKDRKMYHENFHCFFKAEVLANTPNHPKYPHKTHLSPTRV